MLRLTTTGAQQPQGPGVGYGPTTPQSDEVGVQAPKEKLVSFFQLVEDKPELVLLDVDWQE